MRLSAIMLFFLGFFSVILAQHATADGGWRHTRSGIYPVYGDNDYPLPRTSPVPGGLGPDRSWSYLEAYLAHNEYIRELAEYYHRRREIAREYDYSSTEALPRVYYRKVGPPAAPPVKEEVPPSFLKTSGPHILTVPTEFHSESPGAGEGHFVIYGSDGSQVIHQIVPPKVKDSSDNGFVVYGGD
jgi:hypothetical protein